MAWALPDAVARIRALRRDDRGYAVLATLSVFLFLFTLVAAVYAVGETIHERIKMQNACDNAAYSTAVVQADGLSRMACVNRAMSWTYVQMSNRQMDYITYRWLKLTSRRFKEDADNAERYASRLTMAVDRELGWWAILEAGITALIGGFFDLDCDTGNHAPSHRGLSWWCGQEHDLDDVLDVNGISLAGITAAANVNKVLEWFSIFDSGAGDGPKNWGQTLGKLIDYDKQNIYLMNRALPAINAQMAVSMAMTAESVLKTTLADNRRSGGAALSDYCLSIQIPTTGDPYELSKEESMSKAVSSYFSPLRNTETDERLFLQMQTKEHSNQPLASFFPCLMMDNSDTAFGLDQWFVRGKGRYDDRENEVDSDDDKMMSVAVDKADEYWIKAPASPSWQNGRSGWLAGNDDDEGNPTSRLTGTVRSEGELGIQRVYKDTNLNESGAGFRLFNWRPNRVDRGNHLLNTHDWLKAGFDAFRDFIGGGSPDADPDDDEEDDGLESYENLSPEEIIDKVNAEIETLTKENQRIDSQIAALNRERAGLDENSEGYAAECNRIDEEIAALEKEKAENEKAIAADREQLSSNWSNDSGSFAADGGSGAHEESDVGGFGRFLGGLLTSVMNKLSGMIVDVDPSCENVHDSGLEHHMCQKARETTALYSQYRWASCKWYCLTKGMTWLYSLMFNDQKIWCDRKRKVFKKFTFFKIRGSGYGHYGFPKWFCSREPHAAASWIERIPPLPGLSYQRKMSEAHGYMDSPWDGSGFIRPISPLWGERKAFARDEYCSCALFPDGAFRFSIGETSWAGAIRGHARIYGDDKEIFDNRYVGAVCKPWVLNARFFNGHGTIVVGAARRFYNPFASLFGMLQQDSETEVGDRSVLSAFDIPSGNYMWTMSAARAAVRHRRRNGAYDGPRQYQVTYDSTCDAENLHYHGNRPVVYDAATESWSDDIAGWEQMNCNGNRRALTRSDALSPPPIYDGCVCRSENAMSFREMWNLCESDWDATLLPLRYAGAKATLNLKLNDGDDVQDFSVQDYATRLALIKYAHHCRMDPDKDDMIGAGTSWVWDTAIRMDSPNPFVSSLWKRASESYFNPLERGWSTSNQLLKKANRLPKEKASESERRFLNLLQMNRVL